MKLKYTMQVLLACCTLSFVACDLDNYGAPDGGIKGSVIDSATGELVPQPVNATTGMRVRLTQQDWEVEAESQLFYAQEDGQFINGQLFDGEYTMALEQTNFFPIEKQTVTINGQTNIRVEVIPYANVSIGNLSIENLTITADAIIGRTWDWQADSRNCKITAIKLYWNVSSHIDKAAGHNLGTGSLNCAAISDADVLSGTQQINTEINSADIDKYAHFIKANDNKIYVRAAVVTKCAGTEYYNYSNIQELDIEL